MKNLFFLLLVAAAFAVGSCGKDKCDTSAVTYTNTIKPLLDDKCIGCHYNDCGVGSYESYDSLKASVNFDRIVGSIKHNAGYSAMPQNQDKLGDCEIQQIEDWIAAGSPR